MNIEAIHTERIEPTSSTLIDLLDRALPTLHPGSIIAITSKIVSLCEGSVVPIDETQKEELIRAKSDLYLPESKSKWGINFTITNDTLIPNAGIDESNAGEVYVLWPKDSQATANDVREYLSKKFNIQELGVVITDSTCSPLRRGVSGIALAFSGIKPLRDYVGSPDLFERPFKVSQADIVGGLAATSVLMMGEGAESTPLALFTNASVVDFVDRNPTTEELNSRRISLDEDLFSPFLEQIDWQRGGRSGGGVN